MSHNFSPLPSPLDTSLSPSHHRNLFEQITLDDSQDESRNIQDDSSEVFDDLPHEMRRQSPKKLFWKRVRRSASQPMEMLDVNAPKTQRKASFVDNSKDQSRNIQDDSSEAFDDLSHEVRLQSPKRLFWKRGRGRDTQHENALKTPRRASLLKKLRLSRSQHASSPEQNFADSQTLLAPNTIRSTDFADEFFDDAGKLPSEFSDWTESELEMSFSKQLQKKSRARSPEKMLILGLVLGIGIFTAMAHAAMFCVHVVPQRYLHPKGSRIESLVIAPYIGPNSEYTLKRGFGMVGQEMRFGGETGLHWVWESLVRVALGGVSTRGILDACEMVMLQMHAFTHATLSSYSVPVWKNFGPAWPIVAVFGSLLMFVIGNLLGHALSVVCVWDEITVGTIPGSVTLLGFALVCYLRTLRVDPSCNRLRRNKSSSAPMDAKKSVGTKKSNKKKNTTEPALGATDDDRELDEFSEGQLATMQQQHLDGSFIAVPVVDTSTSSAVPVNTSKFPLLRFLRCCLVCSKRTIYGSLFAFQVAFWLIVPIVIPIASAFGVWGGMLAGVLFGIIVVQFSSLLGMPSSNQRVRFLAESKWTPLKLLTSFVTGGVIPALILLGWAGALIGIFVLRTDASYDYTPEAFRYFGMSVEIWERLYDPWFTEAQ